MTDCDRFKRQIAAIKEATGLTQAEIAEKIGVKSTYLSDMANGRVPITTNVLAQLSEQFHIKPEAEDMVSMPREVWEVIQNQAASLRMKDEQMSEVIAILKEERRQGNGAGGDGRNFAARRGAAGE